MPYKLSAGDPIPFDLSAEIVRLRLALDDVIPPKEARRNLLVASWNIGDFEELSSIRPRASDELALEGLFSRRCVAEIASRFDLVAIQGIAGDEPVLAGLLQSLGESCWGVLHSEGRRFSGHREEQVVFLYDRHRVTPSGLACELIVLPGEASLPWDTFARQFTCTPFAASFVACGRPFIVVTTHLIHGPLDDDRVPEVEAVGRWLSSWAADEHAVGHNLLLVGDFALDWCGDPCHDALAQCGLHIPAALRDFVRETRDTEARLRGCDQIAWFTDREGRHLLSLDFLRAGAFDLAAPLSDDLPDDDARSRVSGLRPLWVEFGVG